MTFVNGMCLVQRTLWTKGNKLLDYLSWNKLFPMFHIGVLSLFSVSVEEKAPEEADKEP